MRELHAPAPPDLRSKEVDQAIAAYIHRCKILMKDAFRRNLDDRRAFRAWIEQKFQNSSDPVVLLHEDPLYMVSRYLGIPPMELDASIANRATKIARDQGW